MRFEYNKILKIIESSDIHYLLLYNTLFYFIISPCLYFMFMDMARKTSNTVQHHWTVLPVMIIFCIRT